MTNRVSKHVLLCEALEQLGIDFSYKYSYIQKGLTHSRMIARNLSPLLKAKDKNKHTILPPPLLIFSINLKIWGVFVLDWQIQKLQV